MSNLQALKDEVAKLSALLAEPETGLMSWNMCLAERLTAIAAYAPKPKAEPAKTQVAKSKAADTTSMPIDEALDFVRTLAQNFIEVPISDEHEQERAEQAIKLVGDLVTELSDKREVKDAAVERLHVCMDELDGIRARIQNALDVVADATPGQSIRLLDYTPTAKNDGELEAALSELVGDLNFAVVAAQNASPAVAHYADRQDFYKALAKHDRFVELLRQCMKAASDLEARVIATT